MNQTFIDPNMIEEELGNMLKEKGVKSILLVCGNSFLQHDRKEQLEDIAQKAGADIVRFSEYEPNPRYESIKAGIQVLHEHHCDCLIAVGGGSGMDVAKAIKLFENMDPDTDYLQQEIIPNQMPFLAIPTTAGTGSESTRYSIFYVNGEKVSIAHESCLPDYVMLDPQLLDTLPLYQRSATMMDALGHAIESYWSVKSSKESRHYAKLAIENGIKYMSDYLKNTEEGNQGMLLAANQAGMAINYTQTTAAHAMCYKLTTHYGISHGHAVGLCLVKIWRYMIQHMEEINEPRGQKYIEDGFRDIAEFLGCKTVPEAIDKLEHIMKMTGLAAPKLESKEELELLVKAVNPAKLTSTPVCLDEAAVRVIYQDMFSYE